MDLPDALYDLGSDPHERVDLLADGILSPEEEEARQRLLGYLPGPMR